MPHNAYPAYTIGDVIADRFRITRRMPPGGEATVFEAHDLKTGDMRAVKVPLDTLDSLAKEVRIAICASHLDPRRFPFIFEVIRDSRAQIVATVMECIEGRDLGEILGRLGRLSVEDAVDIAIQILEALSVFQKYGIVWWDLKPENIMIQPDRNVKIIDFTLAQDRNDPQDGIGRGTPVYAAPETWDGKSDMRSDLYSLGILLYEVLAGARPLRKIVMKLLKKKPEDRFQTPQEARRALADFALQEYPGRVFASDIQFSMESDSGRLVGSRLAVFKQAISKAVRSILRL